jgi:Glycosyl hydrolase catalytic core
VLRLLLLGAVLLSTACRPLTGLAGEGDAGPDAGADAGPAGADAGPAGADAGPDAGTDAGSPPDAGTPAKSAKRGVAYDFADLQDLSALAPGVSWFYNWSPAPNPSLPADFAARTAVSFQPMLWNWSYDFAALKTQFLAAGGLKYLLVLNEPNLTSQANVTPADAAAQWPQYEQLADALGARLVGPAITWGTMPGYQDPVAWLDAFYAAYRAANGNRDPRIDYLAFHWYDYGIGGQLDRLTKYGKPFWVTEFANTHSQNDGAQIDTLAKQEAQMTEMVQTLEGRADVFRYAWFTGRWSSDPHFASLLGAPGTLTGLGQLYLSLPYGD